MKLCGGISTYMMGLVVGISIVSTLMQYEARDINQRNENNYIESKKQYALDLVNSLKYKIYSEDTVSSSSYAAADTDMYVHTNIFDANDVSANVATSIDADGEKTVSVVLESNDYENENLNSPSSINSNLKDSSTSAMLDEHSVRKAQITKSYSNMKQEAYNIYNTIITTAVIELPDSYTPTLKDAWGNDFSYSKIDNSTAILSFNLPWNPTQETNLKLKIPYIEQAPTADTFKVIMSEFYALALTSNGDVWGAGISDKIGLGNGSTTGWEKSSLSDIKDIYVFPDIYNSSGSFAVANNGDLYVSGSNSYGQLGLPDATNKSKNWTLSLTGVDDVHLNYERLAVVSMLNGDIYVTGHNNYKYMGFDDVEYIYEWRKIPVTNPRKIALGWVSAQIFVLTESSELYVAGINETGHLGVTGHPAKWALSLTDVKDFSTPDSYYSYSTPFDDTYILAIKNDGTVWGVGNNENGQLGIGSKTNQTSWVNTGLTDIVKIKTYQKAAFAFKSNGDLYVAGDAINGSLGTGSTGKIQTWTKVAENVVDAIYKESSPKSSMIVKSDGTVWASGKKECNNIGYDNSGNTKVYTQATALSNVKAIFRNGIGYADKTLAVTNDGKLWTAGDNADGALGTGSKGGCILWHDTGLTNIDYAILDMEAARTVIAVGKDKKIYGAGYNSWREIGGGSQNQATFIETKDFTDL